MTAALLAAFETEDDFLRAFREAGRRNLQVLDSFTPFMPDELAGHGGIRGPAIVTAALVTGGLVVAACFYLMEFFSATVLYPFNSGDRPHDSWPVFMMGPFEFGVFAAGFCGFVALLIVCRLPRPHQPLFDAPGIERASQDTFFLALEPGETAERFALDFGASSVVRAEL